MQQMTIAEFLAARIAEDETAALAAISNRWREAHRDGWNWSYDIQGSDRDSTEAQDDHVRIWWPGRVLAECAAKRAIIEHWGPFETLDGPNLLTVLATVYKDHPDYQEEWSD